jgi:hypothetical protein
MARRPGSVTTMGVLNLVFGSLFLLVCFCDGVLLVASRDPDNMMLWEEMKDQVPGFVAVRVGGLLLHILLFILLIVAGIGLLNMAAWGRALSIVYAVASILLEIAMLIYQLAFINPVMNRFVGQFGGGGPDIGGVMMIVLTVVTVIIYALVILYAVLLLIMMLTPTVAEAFAGRSRDLTYEAGGRGDEGDDYERRRPRDGWNS